MTRQNSGTSTNTIQIN